MKRKKGQIQDNVGAIITLIIGVGVASLVLIFVGALGGQTYNLVQNDIVWNQEGNIGYGITNNNIATDIEDAIESGFTAIKTTGNYLPIVVLAVIIFIVLSLVVGFGGGGAARYAGGAL